MRVLKLAGNVLSAILVLLGLASLLGLTALPDVLGYKTYVVLSGSMAPAIPTGSVLIALPVSPTSLKVGDVIVYNRSDVSESVTHRIVQVNDDVAGKPSFITKGDANSTPDSWTVQYNGNTAGKVVLSVPFLGYAYHAVGSPRGRLIFLVVPVLVLTLLWLAEIWRPSHTLRRMERELPPNIAPPPSVPVAGSTLGPEPPSAKADPPPLVLRQ